MENGSSLRHEPWDTLYRDCEDREDLAQNPAEFPDGRNNMCFGNKKKANVSSREYVREMSGRK